jgi:alcohol dehydrogenase (NADP+)
MATTVEPQPTTASRPTVARAWGTDSADQPLRAMDIERRALRADDVAIRITYCGICHSDLHQARDEWHNSIYPVVPGHEIVGEVTAVGSDVTALEVGETVAVGVLVDSCMHCHECLSGWEQFCVEGMVLTYNGIDRHDGSVTKGGYSDHIVTREHFVHKLPASLDPGRAAPLLCAGITTYSPLRQYEVGPGTKVGVAGLGGLGHLGVKFAHALGAHVTMITTSPAKGEDARELGADDVLISTDETQMAAASNRFDFILNTIPVAHDLDPYLRLLGRAGAMVLVGAIEPLPGVDGRLLIGCNRAVGGSAIGGVPETSEMLDFCAEHQLYPEVEFIAINQVNEAYERMLRGDVRYRFVIDMSRGI